MTLVYLDRVLETTRTSSTGAYALDGPVQGYQAFAQIGNGNTCYYTVTDGTAWEVGIGTYSSASNTLSRTSIKASSNGNSAVSWGAGSKNIWLDFPAFVAGYLNGRTPGPVIDLTNGTGLPLTTGVTGLLPTVNGGTPYVADRATAKALDPTRYSNFYISGEGGRNGFFLIYAGVQPVADPQEGVFFPMNAPGYYAARVYAGALDVSWFGMTGNGIVSDLGAFQACYALLKLLGSAITEGPRGEMKAPAGRKYLFDGTFALDVPAIVEIGSEILYSPTTGSAVVVGSTSGTNNTHYYVEVTGIRATNGNTSQPTGVNLSGSTGIELRNLQFSTVINNGIIIAFTNKGVWGNQTNNVFSGQQCQDNNIFLGEIAFCGQGFSVQSHGAADGSFQVNLVRAQNIFANWQNVVLGEPGDNNTNNNLITLNALDADTGGGNVTIYGLFNKLEAGYCHGAVSLQSGSAFNDIWLGVGTAQATVTDAGSGNTIYYASGGFYTPISGGSALRAWSDAAGTGVGPTFDILRARATPAANDSLGEVRFLGKNDAAAQVPFAVVRADVPTVTSGNENGRLLFDTYVGGTYGNRAILWLGLAVGSGAADKGVGTVNVSSAYYVAGTKVVGARVTGWTAMTGTATKGGFDTGTVTLVQLAQVVKALQDSLTTHGLIGT